MFYGQVPAELILFFMLYGGAAVAAVIACIYLCMRKGNAFSADVTSPVPLRRWAATFFAVSFLSHVWWLLFYIYSGDIHSVSCVVVAVLDSVTLLPTIAGTLLSMLQDRRRPVWPLLIATTPYVVFMALSIVYPTGHFMDIAIAYILLLYVLFTIYMEFAVRQYGRWLRENYADLEHKEVWVSHVLVIAILILIIGDGVNGGDMTISYLVQVFEIVLFGLLLWRLETLPQLEKTSMGQRAQQLLTIPTNIEQLLAERCVDTQLYLQHDLTLLQLAQAVGTNRFYLSQYFSRQGITYNTYINNLRINHFMNLYREAISARQSIIAQQLAHDSGYRSYSTFSLAFKQRMGQSVTAWMHNTAK